MKNAVLAALASMALAASSANAVDFTVASCDELAEVDDTTVTSLTITASPFECAEYTRLRVRNTMTLDATVSEVVFSNFSLKVLRDLTVEANVEFTGVTDQVKNGGVLYVAEGATATFMGTSSFTDNSVMEKTLEPISCGTSCSRTNYVIKKGGAIHNKGNLVFEGDATFERNEARVADDEDYNVGKGGSISNAAPGIITFKGKLTIEDGQAEGVFVGQGGALYNRGDIVVGGEAFFSGNRAGYGAAIYQTRWGTLTFNGMTTFSENYSELNGGGITNIGGVVNFNAGSLFDDNGVYFSDGESGSGGAIYNYDGGVITHTGSTTFSNNYAWYGGAVLNQVEEPTSWDDDEGDYSTPTITFPDDVVFEGNSAEYCPDVSYAEFAAGREDDACWSL